METGADIGPLVTCEWLQDKVTSGDLGTIVIVDVTWSSEKNCYEEFQKRHIPGAQYLNVLVGPHTHELPRSLPPLDVFQESARAAGINQDSHVILYSDSDNCGFFLSSRAWWTFLVFGFPVDQLSILNGGLQRWNHLGNPTTDQLSPVPRGNFVAQDKSGEFRLPLEALTGLQDSGSDFVLLDTRAPTLYCQGHVPGADSFSYTRLVDQEKMEMKPLADLQKEFATVDKAGGGLEHTRLVPYCNSGMSSCTVVFAAMLCGIQNFQLFHGGFNEWKSKCPEKIKKSSA